MKKIITILIITATACMPSSSYALIKSLATQTARPVQHIMWINGPGRFTADNKYFKFPVITINSEGLTHVPPIIDTYLQQAQLPDMAPIAGPLTKAQSTQIQKELAHIPGPGKEYYQKKTKFILENALRNQQLLEEQGFSVFYTAQNLRINIIQDLLYMYYQKMGHQFPTNFLPLRDPDPQRPYPLTKVESIYDKYSTPNEPIPHDNYPELRTALISASAGLIPQPTNLRELAFENGEHAMYFFKKNFSVANPRYLFESIIRNKISDPETANNIIDRLLRLANRIHPSTGTLVQIAIPNPLIAQIVYQAHPYGVPRHMPESEPPTYIKELYTLSDAEKAAYVSGKPLHEILQIIRHEPTVQVRIVATSPEMINPTSGVQIIRYDPELLPNSISYEEYRQELAQIVNDMLRASARTPPTARITELES